MAHCLEKVLSNSITYFVNILVAKSKSVSMNKYKTPNVKTFEFTKIIGIENIDFGKCIIIDDFVLIYAKEKTRVVIVTRSYAAKGLKSVA